MSSARAIPVVSVYMWLVVHAPLLFVRRVCTKKLHLKSERPAAGEEWNVAEMKEGISARGSRKKTRARGASRERGTSFLFVKWFSLALVGR